MAGIREFNPVTLVGSSIGEKNRLALDRAKSVSGTCWSERVNKKLMMVTATKTLLKNGTLQKLQKLIHSMKSKSKQIPGTVV